MFKKAVSEMEWPFLFEIRLRTTDTEILKEVAGKR